LQQSPISKNKSTKILKIKQKQYVLKNKEPVFFEPRTIEILRRSLIKQVKKKKIKLKWKCNVNPDSPVTRKGRGTRMGTGKGTIRTWIYKTLPNNNILEIKKNKLIKPFSLLTKTVKANA